VVVDFDKQDSEAQDYSKAPPLIVSLEALPKPPLKRSQNSKKPYKNLKSIGKLEWFLEF
jgi:hypothetical protein